MDRTDRPTDPHSTASTASSGHDDIAPSLRELRISARLLLHIARQPRIGPDDIPVEALTQAGMATALGTGQAAVSNALRRLVDGGALRVERSHVRHRVLRLKVYALTSEGERIVRQIRLRFGPPGDGQRD